MADSARIAMPAAASREWSQARVTTVPWFIWSAVLAVTSTTFGLYWDISWHMGIGRDTFWTPAHMAIQFGAVLTGISCAYLILHTTFAGSAEEKAAAVNIWGFRGPLGAFIAAWGGFAMLTSAPFDDWWHNAYGLDVKILSPPPMVLILGAMNRADGAARRMLERLFLYVAGMMVVALMVVSLEYQGRVLQHSATFYRVICM